jgi:chemotaxis regulatin CheY-phosphate phosphatase CheZ
MSPFWRRERKQPVEQIEHRVDRVASDVADAITRLEYVVNREMARIRAEEDKER